MLNLATGSGVATRPAATEGQVSLSLPFPCLLFLGDTVEPGYAKTALGLCHWVPERCVGELALAGATVTTGLPAMSVPEAADRGARALLIGVATRGGQIPDGWLPTLTQALESGLDIVSGMHMRLSDLPVLSETAQRLGRRLIDVRVPPQNIPIATGRKRSGRRLLTVGTDCALGKKYAALAISRALADRGLDVDFRATGQTGIMIAGGGIPIDAVVSDFIAGAAEMLSPDAAPGHLDVIEGQGSMFHPSYAAVTLGLLHGSQPDLFVVCHDPGRTHLLGLAEFALPSIEHVIEQIVALGRLVNPAIRCCGISLNTSMLDNGAAAAVIMSTAQRLGLPVADPVRGLGMEALLDACVV